MATLQLSHFLSASSSSSSSSSPCPVTSSSRKSMAFTAKFSGYATVALHRRRRIAGVVGVGKEDTEVRVDAVEGLLTNTQLEQADPQDLEYVRQIQRVKLTVMIEDPREVERRRLLGIEDPDTPTRENLVEALEQVNEGKVPENRLALRMLAEEMINWPNLEGITKLYDTVLPSLLTSRITICFIIRLKHQRKSVPHPYMRKPQTLELILKRLLRD